MFYYIISRVKNSLTIYKCTITQTKTCKIPESQMMRSDKIYKEETLLVIAIISITYIFR